VIGGSQDYSQAKRQGSPAETTSMEIAANMVKIVGEAALVPGFSLFLDGKVLEGGVHAAVGVTALRLLGVSTGPLAWLLVAANSYSKSVSNKPLHEHFKKLLE
jgi:hypothetical protein